MTRKERYDDKQWRSPHPIGDGAPEAWYYETLKGLEIYTEHGLVGRISWQRVESALRRKAHRPKENEG